MQRQLKLSAVLTLVVVLAIAFADAENSAAADRAAIELAQSRAVTGLLSMQREDGGFGGRLELRDSAAVLSALRSAGTTGEATERLSNFVVGATASDVDSLSRLLLAGESPEHLSRLLDEQRPDGGFGLTKIYESDPLDTALAVQALYAVGETQSGGRAVEKLLKLAGAEFDWASDESVASTAISALHSAAAVAGSNAAVAVVADTAVDRLAQAQNANGNWGSNGHEVRSTALAVCAISPEAGNIERVSRAADFLLERQLSDGTWSDPYSTALSLRALGCALSAQEREATSLLPDPSVRAQDIRIDPATVNAGDSATATFVVTNRGANQASDVTAEVFLGEPSISSQPVATVEVGTLGAGQAAPLQTQINFPNSPGRMRVYIVLIVPSGQDRDIGNNVAFANASVAAAAKSFIGERDWPRPGGDIQRSGVVDGSIHAAIDPTPIWQVEASGAPIAAQGKVMFGHGSHVEAVDAATGALLWAGGNSLPEAEFYRAPIYSDGYVYTGGVGGESVVNAQTGQVQANSGTWGGSGSGIWLEQIPNSEGDDVLIASIGKGPTGFCFIAPFRGMTSGPGPIFGRATLWPNGERNLHSPCQPMVKNFASDGKRAFGTYGNGYVVGFDFQTFEGQNGETERFLFDRELQGIVRPGEGPMINSLGDVVVSGWDGSRGTNGEVLASGKGRVSALNPQTGSQHWTFETDEKLDGTPVGAGQTTYVVDRAGTVYALSVSDGSLRWQWQADGYVPPARAEMGSSAQTLLISNNRLFVPHPDGHVYTLDLKTGQAVSSTSFTSRPFDLAADDQRDWLYVRTIDGTLGAYDTNELSSQCAPDPGYVPTFDESVELASVATDGSQLPGVADAGARAISADGTRVAFAMRQPTTRTRLFVRDVETGVTTEVPESELISGRSFFSPTNPSLSADGRFLLYDTTTINQFTGQGERTLLVRDLDAGGVTPLLRNSNGTVRAINTQGIGSPEDGRSAISADGNTVVFASAVTDLVPGDTNGFSDIFAVKRDTGSISRVSATADGSQLAGPSYFPSISEDGTQVAFLAQANATGTGSSLAGYNVFVRNLDTGLVRAASQDANGNFTKANRPRISANGRYIAFDSDAASLIAGGLPHTSGIYVANDVYVFDQTTGTREMVTLNDAGERDVLVDGRSGTVSDDGRFAAFSTNQSLAKGDASFLLGSTDIVRRDREQQTTALVSRNRWGVSNRGGNTFPLMSLDGRTVVFTSTSNEFSTQDTDTTADFYIQDATKVPDSNGVATGELPPECQLNEDSNDNGFSDLAVSADDVNVPELEAGQRAEINVTVRNEGDSESEESSVGLSVGSGESRTVLGEASLPAIPPGQSAQAVFTWDPVATGGDYDLVVEADPQRTTFETELANNTAIKQVAVSSPTFDVSTTTIRESFGANEDVEIETAISTSSPFGRTATFRQKIVDENEDTVIELEGGAVDVSAGDSDDFVRSWNTQDTTAGRYTVVTELVDSSGQPLFSDSVDFDIEPSVAASISAATDSASYGATSSPNVTALVENGSDNADLSDVRVQLVVTDSSGDIALTDEDAISTVPIGGAVAISKSVSLQDRPPGTYSIAASLVSADQTVLDSATAEFVVNSSAETASGLTGRLGPIDEQPYQHSTASVGYEISNSGNTEIAGASVELRFADLESGDVVKTLNQPRDLGMGASVDGQFSVVLDLDPDRNYQVGLYLKLANGVERPLDRSVFRLRPAPFTASSAVDTGSHARVLVWACNPADEAIARAALGETFVKVVPDFRTTPYLGGLGCTFLNHAEEVEFLREMRSGHYNQFWVLGRHHPFENGTADELAARVIQGDGLLVAGGDPLFDLFFNRTNLSPLGARLAGVLLPGNYNVSFASNSSFAGLDTSISGSPIKIVTSGSTSIATTRYSYLFGTATAVVGAYNQFANGKSVYLGFPPEAIRPQSSASAILDRAKTQVASTSSGVREGGVVKVDVRVEGVAPGSPLETRTTLPVGVEVVEPPSDVTSVGGVLKIPFSSTGTAERTRSVWLRLPSGVNSVALSTTVYYRDSVTNEMVPFGQPFSTSISTTETKQAAWTTASSAVNAISGVWFFDVYLLQKIKADLAAAGQPTSSPSVLLSRIRALVADIGVLESKGWAGSSAARVAIARLVSYLETEYHEMTE